jgi:hypothetical protein
MLTTWLGDGESEHIKLESLSYPRAPRRMLITQHRVPPALTQEYSDPEVIGLAYFQYLLGSRTQLLHICEVQVTIRRLLGF